MPDISFITTCKGRLEHLRQTLPRMVAQPNCESIVVDYGCPDNTAGWIATHFPSVKVVNVTDDRLFHKSRAQNLGVAMATAPWLCLVDADILIDPEFTSIVLPKLSSGFYFRPRPLDWNAYGSFICTLNDFKKVTGYDETIESSGCMDDDLYARLDMAGVKSADFSGKLFVGIDHDDAMRSRFYEIKNRALSQCVNALYSNIKHDLMRASGGGEISATLRSSIYAEVKQAVLEAHATGRAPRTIELSLPASSSVPLQRGLEIRRKWVFTLASLSAPASESGNSK